MIDFGVVVVPKDSFILSNIIYASRTFRNIQTDKDDIRDLYNFTT